MKKVDNIHSYIIRKELHFTLTEIRATLLPFEYIAWFHACSRIPLPHCHPELSGCITTLTVRNGGCKILCSNGHLDRSRCLTVGFAIFCSNPLHHHSCGTGAEVDSHKEYQTLTLHHLEDLLTLIGDPVSIII